MVEELHNKERLEGLLRILPHNPELAAQLIQFMIDEIDLKVEEFEKEPAYKRKGLDLNDNFPEAQSRLSIENDGNN